MIGELGDNSYQEANIETFDVQRMKIELGGSGAITGLKFTAQVPEPSTCGCSVASSWVQSFLYVIGNCNKHPPLPTIS